MSGSSSYTQRHKTTLPSPSPERDGSGGKWPPGDSLELLLASNGLWRPRWIGFPTQRLTLTTFRDPPRSPPAPQTGFAVTDPAGNLGQPPPVPLWDNQHRVHGVPTHQGFIRDDISIKSSNVKHNINNVCNWINKHQAGNLIKKLIKQKLYISFRFN